MTDQIAETNVAVKKPDNKRWFAVVGVLLGILLIGGLWLVQRSENQHLAAGREAVTNGDWNQAVLSLTQALETKPAFLQRHQIEAFALRGVAYYHQQAWDDALSDFDAALGNEEAMHDIYAYRADVHFRQHAFDDALADAETAMQTAVLPPHLTAMLNADMALMSAANGEMETAVSAADDALAQEAYLSGSQLVDLYTLKATQAAKLGEAEDALAYLQKALSVDTTMTRQQETDVLVPYATVLAEYGAAQDALAVSEQALANAEGIDDADLALLYKTRAEILMSAGELETAVSSAEQAATYDDSLALPHVIRALLAYQQFDYEAALAAADEALALDPQNSVAHRVRGAVYTWLGQIHEALTELDLALSTNPEDVEALSLRVNNFLALANEAAAAADVDLALSLNPEAPAAVWAQGLLASYQGDYGLEKVLLDQAVALDPSRPEFYVSRCYSISKMAELPNALADIEAALALNPNFVPAIMARQWVLAQSYKNDDQEEVAHQIVALAPDWPDGYNMLAWQYLDEGDYENAMLNAEKAIELIPDLAGNYVTRGYVYFDQDENDLARADFELALTFDPKSTGALAGLARISIKERAFEEAEAYYAQLLEIAPNSRYYRSLVASYHLDYGNFADGWELVNQVLADDPDYPEAVVIRADILANSGKRGPALNALELLLAKVPNYAVANRLAGEYSFALGDNESAKAYAEAALALDPKLADAAYLLYSIALAEEDVEAAEKQIEAWLEKMPEHEIDYEKLGRMYLSLGNYELGIEALSQGLTVEDAPESLNFWRGMAYFDTGEMDKVDEEMAVVLERSSDISMIADAEYFLALSEDAPQLVNGRFEYIDDTYGFKLSYADYWERQLTESSSDFAFLLIYRAEETVATLNMLVIPSVPGLTLNDLVTILGEQLQGVDGIVDLGVSPVTIGGYTARVRDYELHRESESGDAITFIGRQYYVIANGQIFIITAEVTGDDAEVYRPEFDSIIESIEFVQ